MENKNQHQFNSREKIPNVAFKMMSRTMWLFDFFGNYSNLKFETLNLKEGQIVVDYGCGPARYILNASKAVGKEGRVIAVDIHPKAMETVQAKIDKYNLKNVDKVLTENYSTNIPENTADVVYALDMFHMVEKPNLLLKEFNRMLKPDGVLILEDGHQPREKTLHKISVSGYFEIIEENKHHVKCKPA